MSSRCKPQAERQVLVLFFLFILLFIPSPFLYAWGDLGHRIVADVAESYLDRHARAEIQAFIGEFSLATIADWADKIRGERPETAHWHFVDIPFQTSRYDPKRDCAEGDCVIAAIQRFKAILADRARSDLERFEALKFLVHFVGDLHQPLHTTNHNDRGGNDLPVTFFEEKLNPRSDKLWNLHAVWDTGLIERTGLVRPTYVERLREWLKKRSVPALQKGTVVDWALEAHRAAVNVAYPTPEDRKLSKDYFEKSVPVMDELLAKAGVRLARVLNEAFQTGK
ncbi:MAG: S1/P1 nuclease [Candidatus Manganitrophus sp. SA1]|nr:S1/P1 nuclease [Candidatus Manganitrophus morganii]